MLDLFIEVVNKSQLFSNLHQYISHKLGIHPFSVGKVTKENRWKKGAKILWEVILTVIDINILHPDCVSISAFMLRNFIPNINHVGKMLNASHPPLRNKL